VLGLNNAIAAAKVVDGIVCGSSKVKMSGIGGIEATQAVIDLCAKHDIRPEIKLIPVRDINRVYELLDAGNDAGVRHVIDIQGSLTEAAFDDCAEILPPKFSPVESGGITVGALVCAICDLLCCCKWC
jgi:uncharacterized zinc-type alcohol dehydrogenase-like protein